MLRLIHVSDTHFGRGRDNATVHDQALFHNIYDRYGFATAIDTYLLVTGDFVDGLEPFDWGQQWRNVSSALAPFRGKLIITPGNHDLDDKDIPNVLWSYDDMANNFGLPTSTVVRSVLQNANVTLHLIGVDSTWHVPLLGKAGIGHLAPDQLDAVRAFCSESTPGAWKFVYLHHRPRDFTLPEPIAAAANLGWAALQPYQDDLVSLAKGDFLSLIGANDLLEALDGRVHVLAFGHDKDYATDCGPEHSYPCWINCNREDTTSAGWVEMTFDADACDIKNFAADGSVKDEQQITRLAPG